MSAEHDPLCHIMLPVKGGCAFCGFIARVRADEQQKARQRVEEAHFCIVDECPPRICDTWFAAARAAGGDA